MRISKERVCEALEEVLDQHDGCCLNNTNERKKVLFALKKAIFGGKTPTEFTFTVTIRIKDEERFRQSMADNWGEEVWDKDLREVLFDDLCLTADEGLEWEVE